MKKLTRSLSAASLLITLVASLALATAANGSARMPQFVLKSAVDGKEVNSNSFSGKVLLVSFFATWCPPCIEEIPTFNELQKRYKNKGFSVVALSVDQGGPSVVAILVKKKKIKRTNIKTVINKKRPNKA